MRRTNSENSNRSKWLASDAAGEQIGQLPDEAWRRVHPLSPLLQTLGAVIALLTFGLYFWIDNFTDDELHNLLDGQVMLWILLGAVAVIATIGGLLWLAWTRTRFAVDDNSVYFQKGVISKQQRVARLNRVQAVDIVEPLVARIFGLARVDIEVAGGANSKIDITYLKREEAEALQAELLGRVKRAKQTTENLDASVTNQAALVADEPDGPEYELLRVPSKRLFAASLTSPGTIGALIFVLLSVIGIFVAKSLTGASWAFMGPATIGFAIPIIAVTVTVVWGHFTINYNCRLSVAKDGVKIRRGLLETRAQTISPTRIQAVELHQGILWRIFGWWRVQANVAGYGLNSENASAPQTLILPVGDRAQALTALWTVVPDLGVHDIEATLDAALDGHGNAAGFITSPASARWLDPIAWRHNGILLTQTATIIRRNRFSRHVTFIPHARVQSVGVYQGPLERALGLMDFGSHSVPGPVTKLQAIHLEPQLAAAILELQAERILDAKARESVPEWQRRMGLSG